MEHGRSSRASVGSSVAELRAILGWSQVELARRIDVSQSWVSRVERGSLESLSFDDAERLVEAMGARLVVRVDTPFLADRQRQRDPAHAETVAYVARRLKVHEWLVLTEVEVGGDRSRGWIDILAFHPASGRLLVIEVKTEVRDLGAIQRALGWYEREAWGAARRAGWEPRSVTGVLMLLATEVVDARVRANRLAFEEAFPVRATALAAVLAGAAAEGAVRRAVVMVDPRSRRRRWLRALSVDGRRSPCPYADYADFMRATAP